ncbi:MAG: SseB family protein [Candidatus Xenobia bacterium]
MTAADVTEQFQISTETSPLMRAMMHAPWLVPTNAEATAPALYKASDGQHRLLLFSTRHAVQEAGLGHETLMKLRAGPLLARLATEVDEVVVDAGSAHALHWKHEQLSGLSRWARVALMEELLPQVARVREEPQRLREFSAWLVLLHDGQLVLAPQAQGRRLAAVFTAEDAAAALAAQLSFPVETRELPGRELFFWLASMALDGIAFNCRGPVGRVSWNHSLISRLARTE